MGIFDLIAKAQAFINGKKTYLVSTIAIITTLIAWSSGTMSTPDTIKAIFAAITAMTLRHGMDNSKGA